MWDLHDLGDEKSQNKHLYRFHSPSGRGLKGLCPPIFYLYDFRILRLRMSRSCGEQRCSLFG